MGFIDLKTLSLLYPVMALEMQELEKLDCFVHECTKEEDFKNMGGGSGLEEIRNGESEPFTEELGKKVS